MFSEIKTYTAVARLCFVVTCHKMQSCDSGDPPANALYEVHTHPRYGKGYQFFGPTDLAIYSNNLNKGYDFRVYGYRNRYTIDQSVVADLQCDLGEFGFINSYGHYESDKSAVAAYGTWAIKKGINIGTSHGLNLYINSLFLYVW